ncbi:octopamine receptor beta-1R-like [Orbicella faveolata]|uniref:octopamine receptor beta-1R-like n=1 Tax=Orbicella faveolata TaxID=48498 RepID=UPI0009E3975B|nr:octopamine receptor beta-1R-like [Orbicella faveolata]
MFFFLYRHLKLKMWFFILGWFFTVVTVLGNALVMYLIITRARLHVTTNWLVLSLALADLCVGLTYFPLLFISNFFRELPIDHTGLWFKLSHTFLYSSSTNLCALTADRFLAITMPLKYTVFMTERRLIISLATAWIAPLLLFTIPSIFTYSNNNASFTFISETFRVSVFQLIPSVLFVFVTGRLCLIAIDISQKESLLLAQIRFNFKPQQNAPTIKKQREKTASVKMIVLIILLFVLCHIGGNYRCFCFVFKLCVASENLKNVIHVLFIVNSAVNPLVYAVLKKDMKNELKRIALDRHCHR